MSKLDKCYKIRVNNFDERNGGQNGKVFSEWFKLSPKLARSSKFLGLSSGAKHLWLWLLCEAAQSRLRECVVHPADISREIHVKPARLLRAIDELRSLEWIRVVTTPKREEREEREERVLADPPRAGRAAGSSNSAAGDHVLTSLEPDPDSTPRPPKPKVRSDQHALPRLAEIWNEHRGSLPLVKGCGKPRRTAAEARFKEASEEEWIQAIRKLASSRFAKGENDRKWKADFDFLIQPESRFKILEGKYDDRGNGNGLYTDSGLAIR